MIEDIARTSRAYRFCPLSDKQASHLLIARQPLGYRTLSDWITRNPNFFCSLLATCKAHDVNPRLYLNSIIADMPYQAKAPQQELLEMLPHRRKIKHPEAIITKEQQ